MNFPVWKEKEKPITVSGLVLHSKKEPKPSVVMSQPTNIETNISIIICIADPRQGAAAGAI